MCCPFLERPTDALVAALEAAVPVLHEHGWEDIFIQEQGNPYISAARSIMLRKALDAKADAVVFLDYDLSFDPQDLLRLVQIEDECVAGTYRYKKDEEAYMGVIRTDAQGYPQVRQDGCIAAEWIPAGFMKLTLAGVRRFMKAYPELVYGFPEAPSVDLFNHGAIEGTWFGEDYAFSKRWGACGGEIWLIPDANITHHGKDKAFPGNFHEYMLRQPGGSNHTEAA